MKWSADRHARTRAEIVNSIILIGAVVLVLSTLQVTLFAREKIFGAVPDLTLVAVLCVAYFRGRYAGAVTGIGAGFLIDAMGAVGISLLPLAYLFFGYTVGYFTRTQIQKKYDVYLLCLVAALLFRAVLTTAYTVYSYKTLQLGEILSHAVLPEFFATAISGLILFFPLLPLLGRQKRKDRKITNESI